MYSLRRPWLWFFGLIFVFILFSNLIFPVTYDDDFFYAASGNPFALQWAQYIGNWHARLVSHIPLRIILQWGYPWTDIASSLLALLFFAAAFMQIRPRFWQSKDPKDYALFGILSALLYAFIPTSVTAYGMTTFFMSNIFALTLLLFFLTPYSALIRGEDIRPRFLPFIAFLAGASHEQASALLPLILLLWIAIALGFLPLKKVPLWFWVGLACFVLGMGVIFLAPSTLNPNRLIGYGGALDWEFLGQRLNWLELGGKRYLYSLANWMFFTKTGAAFIPNAWPYFIAIGFLAFRVIRERERERGLLNNALFYFIGAWGLITVMMFSPLYYQASLIFGITFLMIALVLLLQHLNVKDLRRLSRILLMAALCIYTVQALAWNHYRKEYAFLEQKIIDAKTSGAEEVRTQSFTQYSIPTPLGNIYPVFLQRTPTFYLRMADYYGSPPIVVDP